VVQNRVARFFLVQNAKTGKYSKIYEMAIKYIRNSSKIDQMYIKICQHLPLQDTPKFTQIVIFGSENMQSGKPGSKVGSTRGTLFHLKAGPVLIKSL
jgi:hypothetical protein